jgi:hypothetical protein
VKKGNHTRPWLVSGFAEVIRDLVVDRVNMCMCHSCHVDPVFRESHFCSLIGFKHENTCFYQPTMDKFIDLLKQIDENKDIKVFHGYFEEDHKDVKIAIAMASDLLIDGFGQCMWDNMDELYEKAEYRVTSGEVDRFGWLSGRIHLKRGILLYG